MNFALRHPISLPAGTKVAAISVGSEYDLALTTAAQILRWVTWEGENGPITSSIPVPIRLPSGVTVTAISAGDYHSLAVASTGQALAWGANRNGQLGDGSSNTSLVPVPIQLPAGTTVTAVSAGRDYSLALTSAGDVFAWGQNDYGQLGNGSTTFGDKNSPPYYGGVLLPVRVRLPAGAMVIAISTGSDHSLALTSAGQVFAWGSNAFGQLGDGTRDASNVPVLVSLPTGTRLAGISAGGGHSLALTCSGEVLAWGSKFGDIFGSSNDIVTPSPVTLPARAKATAISAGGAGHSLALTSTGRVLAWANSRALGNGTSELIDAPLFVTMPSGITVTAISSGRGFFDMHNLAMALPAGTPGTSQPTASATPEQCGSNPPPLLVVAPRPVSGVAITLIVLAVALGGLLVGFGAFKSTRQRRRRPSPLSSST